MYLTPYAPASDVSPLTPASSRTSLQVIMLLLSAARAVSRSCIPTFEASLSCVVALEASERSESSQMHTRCCSSAMQKGWNECSTPANARFCVDQTCMLERSSGRFSRSSRLVVQILKRHLCSQVGRSLCSSGNNARYQLLIQT